jgi:hypothetical protein|tara:strand:- start:47 stop:199 length:153 start_codon:yes stop_codon:yes gene_type:complete
MVVRIVERENCKRNSEIEILMKVQLPLSPFLPASFLQALSGCNSRGLRKE